MSEPIVYADQWRAVMRAAGYRCQCRGECGNPHKKGAGRCHEEHDKYASKHRGPVRLIAAPADPTASGITAARAVGGQLWAWCPDCHDGVRRAAAREERNQPSEGQDDLFAI